MKDWRETGYGPKCKLVMRLMVLANEEHHFVFGCDEI